MGKQFAFSSIWQIGTRLRPCQVKFGKIFPLFCQSKRSNGSDKVFAPLLALSFFKAMGSKITG